MDSSILRSLMFRHQVWISYAMRGNDLLVRTERAFGLKRHIEYGIANPLTHLPSREPASLDQCNQTSALTSTPWLAAEFGPSTKYGETVTMFVPIVLVHGYRPQSVPGLPWKAPTWSRLQLWSILGQLTSGERSPSTVLLRRSASRSLGPRLHYLYSGEDPLSKNQP
jgi:hypothetical protein